MNIKMIDSFIVLIPFIDFKEELLRELKFKNILIAKDLKSIIIIDSSEQRKSFDFVSSLIWTQDIWLNCNSRTILSINSGIEYLKSFKNRGCYFPAVKSNFGMNISKQVRNFELKRIVYKINHDFDFKFTAWLMSENLIFTSENTYKKFPFGWHEFVEDKESPPNRAYLKLWELFTAYNIPIHSNDIAIEVGSSPGGWTWVLSQRLQKVYSIDRAPLADKINKIKNIEHKNADAFKLNPTDYTDATWFFSDLICTPDKIYEMIQYWMSHSKIENFICTIKFKGNCPYQELEKFLVIDHSMIVHLYHNKNEVTWIRTPRLNKKNILSKNGLIDV